MPSVTPFLKRYLKSQPNYQKHFFILIAVAAVLFVSFALTKPATSGESSLIFNINQAKQGQLSLSGISPLMQVKTRLALVILNLTGQQQNYTFIALRFLTVALAILSATLLFYLTLSLCPQKPQIAVLALAVLLLNGYWQKQAYDFSGQMLFIALMTVMLYLSLEVVNSKQPFFNLSLAFVVLFLFNQLTPLAALLGLPLLVGSVLAHFYLEMSQQWQFLAKVKSFLTVIWLALTYFASVALANYLNLYSQQVALNKGFLSLVNLASQVNLSGSFLAYNESLTHILSYLFFFFVLIGSLAVFSSLLTAKKVTKTFFSQLLMVSFFLLTLAYQFYYEPELVAALGLVPLFIIGTNSVNLTEAAWLLVLTAEAGLFLLSFF
jgi:hypothetical protein